MKMRHCRAPRRDPRNPWMRSRPRRGRTEPWVLIVEPDYAADTLAALKGDGTEQLPPGTNPIKGEIVRLLP